MTRSCRTAPPSIVLLATFLSVPAAVLGQQPTLLEAEDFDRWERLGRSVLSPMGDWVAYEVTRNDESRELRVWGESQDSTIVIPWAGDPSFSPDGRWLAWAAGHSTEEEEAARDSDTPLREGVGLLDLRNPGSPTRFDDVMDFSFDPTGEWLALLAHRSGNDSEVGAGLRVVELDSGGVTSFGSVGEMSWARSGPLLAMIIASGSDEGNGLQVYDAGSGRLHPLDHSGSRYTGLSWRREAADLAVLRSEMAASEDAEAYAVLAWRNVTSGGEPDLLNPRPAGLGDTLQVVEHHTPTWSPTGTMVSVGLRPVPQDLEGASVDAEGPAQADASPGGDPPDGASSDTDGEESPETADVQIWHSDDVEVYAQQEVAEERRGSRTLTAIWHLEDDGLVMVSSGLDTSVEILRGWDRALEETDRPYPWGAMFGRPYHDVWSIDLRTGARAKVRERVRYAWASDGGRWLLSFDGEDYLTVDLESGVEVNLTGALPAEFADTAYDT
ncbi:MAG: hypothetical protein OEO23_11465, partial [Gemmatimonadota bacterium]|nr:hypothetical protein [Gemmatimonadota bacterium]